MAAFVTPLTVTRHAGYPRLTYKRPRHQVFRRSPSTRAHYMTNKATPRQQSTNQSQSLTLSYNVLKARTNRGRTSRSKFSTSLQAVQMPVEDRAKNEEVTVWLVASKETGGVLLRGRAKGFLKRSCDRCGCAYDEVSDGVFDVLLKAELGDVDETLYDDVQIVDSDEVEVSGHVRDALYLGMETRALCKEDCAGFILNPQIEEDVLDEDVDAEIDGEGTIAQLAVGDALLEMKKRLEQEGM